MSADLPTVALSIQQPWAWLIVNGHKNIENRTWRHSFRGPVLIHAGKKVDRHAASDLFERSHPVTGEEITFPVRAGEMYRGGIVGAAEIVDCVSSSDSPWFVGPYGFVLRNARPLPFMPCNGALGFFKADYREPAHA